MPLSVRIAKVIKWLLNVPINDSTASSSSSSLSFSPLPVSSSSSFVTTYTLFSLLHLLLHLFSSLSSLSSHCCLPLIHPHISSSLSSSSRSVSLLLPFLSSSLHPLSSFFTSFSPLLLHLLLLLLSYSLLTPPLLLFLSVSLVVFFFFSPSSPLVWRVNSCCWWSRAQSSDWWSFTDIYWLTGRTAAEQVNRNPQTGSWTWCFTADTEMLFIKLKWLRQRYCSFNFLSRLIEWTQRWIVCNLCFLVSLPLSVPPNSRLLVKPQTWWYWGKGAQFSPSYSPWRDFWCNST